MLILDLYGMVFDAVVKKLELFYLNPAQRTVKNLIINQEVKYLESDITRSKRDTFMLIGRAPNIIN